MRVCRSTSPTDTLRCVSSVCIRPAQNPRGRVHKHITLLRCANVIQGPIQTVYISTDLVGDVCTRFSRVLVDDVLGVEVGGGETQNSNNHGNHRRGFVMVLPGYFHLPFRARDDLTSGTGKCDSPFWRVTNDA